MLAYACDGNYFNLCYKDICNKYFFSVTENWKKIRMDVLALVVTPAWCHGFYWHWQNLYQDTRGFGKKWIAGTKTTHISTWRKNTKEVLGVGVVEDLCSFAIPGRWVVTRRVLKPLNFTVCHIHVSCAGTEREERKRIQWFFPGWYLNG